MEEYTKPAANEDFVEKFEGSKSIGKLGEEQIVSMFAKWPHLVYRDMSEVPGYQFKEVDAIIDNTLTGASKAIEIKTDLWTSTPNLLIETMANEERQRLGWIYTTSADWLVYYFINGLKSGEPNLWFIEMEQIRNLLHQYPNLNKYSAPPERQVHGEGWKTTTGVKLPRKLVTPVATYSLPPLNINNSHSSRLPDSSIRKDWKN